MRIAVLTSLATVSLLAACGQGEDRANAPAANDEVASAEAPKEELVPMAPLATKEEALKVMHERHEGMEQIGKSTKLIKRSLDSSSPDVTAIQKAAATIADLAAKTPGWFPAGTGTELGKTGAKPEIWQNQEDFSAKDRDFRQAAQALDGAARAGELSQIKARFADLGKSCKACHDKYRSDMHH